MCVICGNPSLRHAPVYSRRGFLKLVGGAAAGVALTRSALFAAGEIPKPQNVLSPDAALARLKKGNKRYVDGGMVQQDFGTERRVVKGGQNPFAGILSCADSRVAPEYVLMRDSATSSSCAWPAILRRRTASRVLSTR